MEITNVGELHFSFNEFIWANNTYLIHNLAFLRKTSVSMCKTIS